MTLQSDITTIQDTIDDIETAIVSKGVTPSGGLATFASAINNIDTTRIGLTREVSSSGVYQMPTSSFTFTLPNDATDIAQFSLPHAFSRCTGLVAIDLSSLQSATGVESAYGAFEYCSNLLTVDLSSLITVSGYSALAYIFQHCTSLTSANLSSLTTVSGSSALYNAFRYCTSLTSVNLSSLTTVSGSSAMQYTFKNTALSTLSFPSLNSNSFGSYTNQFNNMLQGVTGCTVHFPSNLQSVIGSWTDVTNGFGGTNTTVLFDLPATT